MFVENQVDEDRKYQQEERYWNGGGVEHIKLDTASKTGIVSKKNSTFDLCSGEAKKRTSLTEAGKQKMPRQTTIVPITCTAKQYILELMAIEEGLVRSRRNI